jgi:DNA modification methylase
MSIDTPTAAVGCGDCGSSGSQALYGAVMAKRTKSAVMDARPLLGRRGAKPQTIYCGDNIDLLPEIPAEFTDLIYIDPPFNSNRNYEVFWPDNSLTRGFEDRHGSTEAYIDFMRPRCAQLYRTLKPTGSFYYHCDWHASHYVKQMLDQIFGENQFQNEIVWKRTPFAGSSKARARQFPRSHDVIFLYTKGKTWTWNAPTIPYSEKYLARFKWDDRDGRGPYRKTLLKTYSQETLERLRQENSLVAPIKPGAKWSYKQFLNKSSGTTQIDDVWTDINSINPVANEREGYPTQKPVALLRRIIEASSDPDDIVLDAFCGCGTTLEAAQRLERRWIGIDISPTACMVMADRLERECGLQKGKDFEVYDLHPTEEHLRKIPHFEFENWAVLALGGIPNAAKVNDWGIDGRIYPVSHMPDQLGKEEGRFGFMDHWYPIQAKQKDKAGRPDIDSFVAAMIRARRTKGYFVSFDFSSDAKAEIRAVKERSGCKIVPITVREILDKEEEVAKMLP